MTNLPEILNWRRVNERVTLSGQPTESQLADIRELGVTTIINLGPHSNKGALEDEAGAVAALGLRYVYIPVDFESPTDGDFSAFCAAMEEVGEEPVHVHCIYNARVSAFMFRYAQEGRGGSSEEARTLMDGIWRPGGVWAKFIGDDDAIKLPNRYKGYEY